MNKLQELKSISTKPELAKLLGIKASVLTYELYVIKPQYTQFTIPKRNGGDRTIFAPSDRLKSIQSSLSNLLLDCLDEINKTAFPRSEIALPTTDKATYLKVKIDSSKNKQPTLSHGFERYRSIITNAMMHLGRKNVLNIDLENFFESFNFGRVRGFFIKNKSFLLNKNIATVIAQIACYNNTLPQGSPCSPVISNLITHSLDRKLALLAAKNNCIYTRYADDITFSTREKIFPPTIMRLDNKFFFASDNLSKEIHKAGFLINNKKTRIQYKDSRQDVTGLIVNQKPNTKKEYWRTARAQCNALFKTGKFTKTINKEKFIGNINELEGQLNFIDQVDYYNRLRQKKPLIAEYQLKEETKNNTSKSMHSFYNGREKTFSEFIFYKLFYANEKPTILTEGKTDNIYLKSTINVLRSSFPSLAKIKSDEIDYELLINFIEYSKRTKFLLELYGGTDYLKSFIINYRSNFKRYTAPRPKKPVIIIVDNDKGPKGLINYIANIDSAIIHPNNLNIKKDIRHSSFIHVFHNLYLVLTPLGNDNCPTDIEYFFDEKDRLKKHKNKCFNTIEKRNETEDLSKDSFSKYIINKQKQDINFDNLKPLLNRICDVLDHYKSLL